MKNTFFYFLFFIFLNLVGQDRVLLSISETDVSVDDFMKTYNKNRLDTDSLSFEDSLKEYLDLYINFKLKVVEAESLGLDTVPSFIRELEGYRKQLVKPYLTDTEISDQLLKEAYERLKHEVSASHILIKIDGDENDTLKAYNEILDIKEKLDNGADFITLAKKFSDDPSVKDNDGNLGYFSALYMVYPFESAAYETSIGNVSDPIKTRFGYHLVKVNDRRNSRGEVKVSHIMIKIDDKKPNSSNLSQNKIYEIYDSLMAGNDFSELAKKYSDDKQSGLNGGELEWFGTNKMVKTFEETSFSLDSIGSFSEPFATEFGWHIVKLLDKKHLPLFEDIEPSLKKKVERDSRSQNTRDVVISRLKKEWGFVEYNSTKNIFYQIINKDFFEGLNILEKINDKGEIMFVFNNNYNADERYVYQKDFAEFFISFRSRLNKNVDLKTTINQLYKTFKEQKILEIETNNLESKYDDFRLLMNEYHDGILLFNLMDEMVWSKAIKDTLGLASFYEQNKFKYMWPNRVSAKIYLCKDKRIRTKVYRHLQHGTDDQNLLDKINRYSELNLSIEEAVFSSGDNPLIDNCIFNLDWNALKKEDIYLCTEDKIVYILDVLLPSNKKLDEIKGMVISDYQSFLENDWLKQLKLKYNVQLNDKLFLLAQQNKLNDLPSLHEEPLVKSYVGSFKSAFLQAVKELGSSEGIYFKWQGNLYTTEFKAP